MNDLQSLVNDLNKREAGIKKLNSIFPSACGVICVKEIKQNFVKNQSLWKKRSPVTDFLYEYNRTQDYRTPKLHKKSKHKNPYKGSVVHANRPILVQTGNLRDSVTYRQEGSTVAIGVFHRYVRIGDQVHDAVAYAKLHNEGGSFKMFGHPSSMPKRKFMPTPGEGPTITMRQAMAKKYGEELSKVMGSWRA